MTVPWPSLMKRFCLACFREPGAACRVLLDRLLREHEIVHEEVQGYDVVALGQLPAARAVHNKEADCCISTQASARVLGLSFVPLIKKPYLMAIRRPWGKLPSAGRSKPPSDTTCAWRESG